MSKLKMQNFALNSESYEASLSNDIVKEYNALIKILFQVPSNLFNKKCIDGSGSKVSVRDVIAYQIGWGSLLMNWYKHGVAGKDFKMPGEGFTTWDYMGLAKHFYDKYQCESISDQLELFHDTVKNILLIVENENKSGNLNSLGVWPWCTLSSGKQWSLSKWVKVNTSSPYKRASGLIKKLLKTNS